MVVGPLIPAGCDALETIEIELAQKGRDLGLLEVLRHDMGLERFGVADNESTAVGLPPHNCSPTILFDLIQHEMKLHSC